MKYFTRLIMATAAAMLSLNVAAQQMTNYDFKQRQDAFKEYARGILNECQQKRERGQIRSHVAFVKCSNGRLAEAWSWYQLGSGDLAAMFLARRLEIAERIDRHVITEGQGQIEVAQAMQQLTTLAQERQRAAATSAQAEAQANAIAAAQARAMAAQEQAARSAATTNALLGAASILGAMGQASRLPYGAYQLPSGMITCNRNGNITQCY